MANGFKALRHASGGTQALTEYTIKAATAAMYNGDAVTKDADGTLVPTTGDVATGTGTFLGCMYVAANGSQQFSPYWPGAVTGATEAKAIVSDDKHVTYKVEVAAEATAANIGDFVSIDVVGTPDTTIGASVQIGVVGAINGPFVCRGILASESNFDDAATVRYYIEVAASLAIFEGAL